MPASRLVSLLAAVLVVAPALAQKRPVAPPPAGQKKPPALDVVATAKHDGAVTGVAFAKDGKSAVSSDETGAVVLWAVGAELKSKAEFRAAGGPGVLNPVRSVALSADRKVAAAGTDDKTVWVWDVGTGKQLRRVRGHADAVSHVFLVAAGKKTRGVSFDATGVCQGWDAEKDVEPKKFRVANRLEVVATDGKILCLSDQQSTVLADLTTGARTGALGRWCEDAAIAPDGKRVVKSGEGVQLLDVKTGKQVWAVADRFGARKVLFTPDGKRVLGLGYHAVHIWDVATGDEVGRYAVGGRLDATCMACAPDGKTLLVGDRGGALTLHKLPD